MRLRAARTPGRRDRLPGARLRPEKIVGPVFATAMVLGAWTAVAHSSGDGWVQTLGALIGGFLLVGLLGPARATHRASCRIIENPADARAGTGLLVQCETSAPLRLRPIDPPGPVVVSNGRGPLTVGLLPGHRGVLDSCIVEIASAAPFGLLWWTSRRRLLLARPMSVAPRTGEPRPLASQPGEAGAEEQLLVVGARSGEPRGVRPYSAGDPPRSVHWPATAHQGSLMVREMESAADGSVTVRVVLPDDEAAAEREAEHALATVIRLLQGGRCVRLITTESEGVVSATVGTALVAGRRLARAVPSVPGAL
jgi:uncharacterized protein (DUF58 family)